MHTLKNDNRYLEALLKDLPPSFENVRYKLNSRIAKKKRPCFSPQTGLVEKLLDKRNELLRLEIFSPQCMSLQSHHSESHQKVLKFQEDKPRWRQLRHFCCGPSGWPLLFWLYGGNFKLRLLLGATFAHPRV